MVVIFQEVLSRALDDPQSCISTMPLTDGVPELRTSGLLEIETTDYPRDSSIVDVFRKRVNACPEAIAVVDPSSSSHLTYAQLDQQSDQLAAWLHRRHMPAETLVGVLAPRSCQTIVAFLGILKANLAYLPLDINAPAARIEAILSAIAGPRLILLGPEVSAPEIQLPGVELMQISDTLVHSGLNGVNGLGNASVLPSATSLAYVIFTSGSTGKPKGVMVEHRSVLRLMTQSKVISRLFTSAPSGTFDEYCV